MRVDAHHHFWEIGRHQYPWMAPNLEALHRGFGPEDCRPMLAEHRIDCSVLVQTISSMDETRWFLRLADEHSFVAGVVGWVDLTAPSVGQALDELRQNPKLVGIRHQVHDESDDNWLLRPDVQRGLSELAKRSFPYDLLIRPPHLAPSLAIARKFPELRLVIDHIAKPRIAQRAWDDWASGMTALSACPNVWCKLSGMITEAGWTSWKATDLKRYIDHVLETFGTDRVVFGSDWPVCLLAGSYDQVVEALEMNVNHLNLDEREAIFGQNAVRCYKLKQGQ